MRLRRMLCQITALSENIKGSDAIGFGKGRKTKNGIDKPIDRRTILQGHLPEMNQLGRILAENPTPSKGSRRKGRRRSLSRVRRRRL